MIHTSINKWKSNRINEVFDWMDYDDTDLSGPSWDGRCGELVDEFESILNSNISSEDSTMLKRNKYEAYHELLRLFKQHIDQKIVNLV